MKDMWDYRPGVVNSHCPCWHIGETKKGADNDTTEYKRGVLIVERGGGTHYTVHTKPLNSPLWSQYGGDSRRYKTLVGAKRVGIKLAVIMKLEGKL